MCEDEEKEARRRVSAIATFSFFFGLLLLLSEHQIATLTLSQLVYGAL